MMNIRKSVFLFVLIGSAASAEPRAPWHMFPFAPAAGEVGSTAMDKDDVRFVGWADGYTNYVVGTDVAPQWQDPSESQGPASGGSGDVVALGRGGHITLTFSRPIMNGEGDDFAVFENGFGGGVSTFLELGWVEVSSDGEHFCRFPNYSARPDPVGSYETTNTKNYYGLASKYKAGFGHPFDLDELQEAFDAVVDDGVKPEFFSDAYVADLTNNFPHLDLNQIAYVRIVDVVGDGTAQDTTGAVIYDPYETWGSAGFDLDAIGVLHQVPPEGMLQTLEFAEIPHQKLSFGSVKLLAVSDRSLPVSFSVQSGPGSVAGDVLSFTGTGIVEVVALQNGDATVAAAAPVLRSFHVAEEIQHIFVEPLANQWVGAGPVQVHAVSSRGLPVLMEVFAGPQAAMIGETNHVLNGVNEVGEVVLRAFQPGDASTAPARDVFVRFEWVSVGSSNAPLSYADWAGLHSASSDGMGDLDDDGIVDIQEYMLGGDPDDSADQPVLSIAPTLDAYGRPAVELIYPLNRRAIGRVQILESVDWVGWSNAVPEIIEISGHPVINDLKVRISIEEESAAYRLRFSAAEEQD